MGSSVGLPPLNRRFTYAFSRPDQVSNRRSGPPWVGKNQFLNFVFSDDQLTDEAEEKILKDPIFDKFFPEIRYAAYLYGAFTVTDNPELLYNNIDQGEDVEILSIVNGEFKVLHLKDIRDTCKLPHKYILGCRACIDEETVEDVDYCAVRCLHAQHRQTIPEELLEETRNWKHLKKKIGDFVFVSPSSVRRRTFSSRIVGLNDIEFDAPEGHLERRQTAMATRGQRQEFKKEHCAICLMSSVCGQGQWCDRQYDKAETEYYTDILERATIPFTDKQLCILLINSGRLSKRYERKESYMTFKYRNGGLEYVVGDIHHGHEESLTYKEAIKILKTHGEFFEPPKFKVTKKLKALLVTTVSIQENRGPSRGWGHHTFPVRFTTCMPLSEKFTQYYYRGHRMREGLSVENLRDIYSAEHRIPLVPGTTIPRTGRT